MPLVLYRRTENRKQTRSQSLTTGINTYPMTKPDTTEDLQCISGFPTLKNAYYWCSCKAVFPVVLPALASKLVASSPNPEATHKMSTNNNARHGRRGTTPQRRHHSQPDFQLSKSHPIRENAPTLFFCDSRSASKFAAEVLHFSSSGCISKQTILQRTNHSTVNSKESTAHNQISNPRKWILLVWQPVLIRASVFSASKLVTRIKLELITTPNTPQDAHVSAKFRTPKTETIPLRVRIFNFTTGTASKS
ncbi:hypothetical protein BDZ45DRAFT_321465 [Acephala macrosclerotiorum]|nr:hypothetical protein BDZ45DRAFT_321465 [Acephala macrosclerotiorum]